MENDRILRPRDVAAAIAVEVAKNLSMAIPPIRKLRSRLGRTALPPEKSQLERYVFQLLRAVQRHCGSVAGKDILEIGPGDNLATGLAFLAAGARSYTVIDRFQGAYGSPAARAWYRLLAENWPGEWPHHLDPERFPDGAPVKFMELAVEDAGRSMSEYDIVCSYAVGEHVSDIAAFADLTRTALKPDGVAMHVIDFSGHQWDQYGDPFLFLKFSETAWKLMGSARGAPNRVRFDEYRDCFEAAELQVSVPCRKVRSFNPLDSFVKARATESFLTMEAEFVLRRRV